MEMHSYESLSGCSYNKNRLLPIRNNRYASHNLSGILLALNFLASFHTSYSIRLIHCIIYNKEGIATTNQPSSFITKAQTYVV
jgi:hypothetical protein